MSLERSAVISECGLYRYRLDRWWGEGPRVTWIMLNPSTADAEQDDPTIRRVIRFSKDWGYDGCTIVNLYPLRATDPHAMLAWEQTEAALEVAEENGEAIGRAIAEAPIAVAAWGASAPDGGLWLFDWIGDHPLQCLGTTKAGYPRHPLYVRADTEPVPWKWQ